MGYQDNGERVSSDQFQPGPNYWSNDPSVVNVAADGLHLKITKINNNWQCGEVYLLQSLGYGTYTVQINSRLDQLDTNTVAAPLFIYADTSHELDNEYSGSGGLIPTPNNAQFVAQPYTVPGNITRYTVFQPVHLADGLARGPRYISHPGTAGPVPRQPATLSISGRIPGHLFRDPTRSKFISTCGY